MSISLLKFETSQKAGFRTHDVASAYSKFRSLSFEGSLLFFEIYNVATTDSLLLVFLTRLYYGSMFA